MENLHVPPQLPGLEAEEVKILDEVAQLLNYIYGTTTLDQHVLATTVLRVTRKCLTTIINEKSKVALLEERVHILHEELQNAQQRPENAEASDCFTTEKVNEEAPEDLVDQPPMDPMKAPVNKTTCASTSDYEVQGTLGGGAYGVVVQCRKKSSNKTVALKVIKDRSSIGAAMEELNILDSLKALGSTRFNIVSCNEAFMLDGHLCLEFEKLDISLADYLRGQGVLQLQEIRPIIQQIAVGLCFLQNAGVFHSDLKPDNIMLVDRCGQALKLQIIDFGLARRNPERWTGCVFQSLGYRAPEVLLGAPLTHSIDVWSVGCIAAEMLMGTLLFPAQDENDMMRRIISTVGQPSDDVLRLGLNTPKFFQESSSGQQPQGRTSQAPGGGAPERSSAQSTQDRHSRLADLLKAPAVAQTEDDQAVQCDRRWFIDLVGKMLHPNGWERITPAEILSHPFITLSHLNQPRFSSYLESSIKYMEACGFWSFGGGENVEQPSSRTTSSNQHRNLTAEHPASALSSQEQPSTRDVFFRETKRSSKKRPLDRSECDRRSLEENEYKRQRTSSDWTSNPRTKTRFNCPTKFSAPPKDNILSGRKRKHDSKEPWTPPPSKKRRL